MNLLRKRQVAELLDVSQSCLDVWVRKGAFPPPFKISPQVLVWDEADVEAWLQSKKNPGERNASSSTGESQSLSVA